MFSNFKINTKIINEMFSTNINTDSNTSVLENKEDNNIYRSQSDSRILIDKDNAVLTIVSNEKAPHNAKIYLEIQSNEGYTNEADIWKITACKTKYHLLVIENFNKKENPPSFGDSGFIYGVNCYYDNTNVLDVTDKWCFIRKITRTQAQEIWQYAKSCFISHDRDKYHKMNSLEFIYHVLVEKAIITRDEGLKLFYISNKIYIPTTRSLSIWHKHKGENIQPVNHQAEASIAAELLLLGHEEKVTSTPKMRLECLFKSHIDNKLIIDWASDLGKDIQFIQDRLGLFVFSCESFLNNALPNTNIPLALVKIILEYVENDYNRIQRVLTPAEKLIESQGRCSIM